VDRAPGLSVRLKLTLSYAASLMLAGALLLAARGRVVSADEPLERVWDEAADPFTTTVKSTINRLRAKLGEPPVIVTVLQGGDRI
jgi:DNA-binding response OmpR family regulator